MYRVPPHNIGDLEIADWGFVTGTEHTVPAKLSSSSAGSVESSGSYGYTTHVRRLLQHAAAAGDTQQHGVFNVVLVSVRVLRLCMYVSSVPSSASRRYRCRVPASNDQTGASKAASAWQAWQQGVSFCLSLPACAIWPSVTSSERVLDFLSEMSLHQKTFARQRVFLKPPQRQGPVCSSGALVPELLLLLLLLQEKEHIRRN